MATTLSTIDEARLAAFAGLSIRPAMRMPSPTTAASGSIG
jgi:hypothetical protein